MDQTEAWGNQREEFQLVERCLAWALFTTTCSTLHHGMSFLQKLLSKKIFLTHKNNQKQSATFQFSQTQLIMQHTMVIILRTIKYIIDDNLWCKLSWTICRQPRHSWSTLSAQYSCSNPSAPSSVTIDDMYGHCEFSGMESHQKYVPSYLRYNQGSHEKEQLSCNNQLPSSFATTTGRVNEAAMPQCLVSLIFHNSRWWGLWAFSLPPPWCNCLTLTFPIAASRDHTSYQDCHAVTSSQPCLSQQSLVKLMGPLIATTLMQLFDSDFPHSHQQGLYKLLRLPCHDVQSPLSFTTAAGEVYESSHCHHPDTIIWLWLSP